MLIPNPASPIKRKVGVDDFGKVRVEMHSITNSKAQNSLIYKEFRAFSFSRRTIFVPKYVLYDKSGKLFG